VKLNPEQSISEAILTIEKIFKKYNPEIPFEFQFADEKVADKFAYEARVGNLVGIFAVLAVVISCLGLFGLAAFMAGQRTKEIGIRKVVGASVISLWKLLSKDFLILIIVACAIAIPFAYLLMNSWLQQYTYRTHVSIWVLLGTSVAAVAITVLTVSYQSIKAAMVNPVNSLESE
jgi:putative ABC transport system permease protein